MARVWIYDRENEPKYREQVDKAKAAKRKPPGRWQVRYYDPRGRDKKEAFAKKPHAEERRNELETQLSGGVYRDPRAGRAKVRDVARTWIDSQHDLKRSTLKGYRDHLDNYILPRWGEVAVADVQRDDLVSWVAELVTGEGVRGWKLSTSQVRRIVNVLSMVLDSAVKSSRIAANPTSDLKLPRLPEPDHVYLDHDQVELLAAAAGDFRPFVLLLAYTGLRYGEAAAITAGSVDLDARRVHVVAALAREGGKVYTETPKNHERRAVPLPDFLVEELRPLVEGREDDAYVFTASRGGPLHYDNVRSRVFSPAVRAAGLGGLGVTMHKLRHTAASLAIKEGADVKVVQTMLGHRSATMTLDRYGHLFPDRLDEVADAMAAGRAAALRKARERAEKDAAETPKLKAVG